MAKNRIKKQHKKLGKSPGSMIYTGDKSTKKLFIEVFDYNIETCIEKELSTIEEAFDFKHSDSVTWININGLNHVEEIEKLGNHYNLHPLVLEDIVSISQRPKIDEYEDYLFVVVKMLYIDKNDTIASEQVSFILGKGYVLSFQESEGDVFDAVRERIRQGKGRARSLQADYLLYILMDTIVDHYFTIIEDLGDKIEDYEDSIFSGQVNKTINKDIQDLKREILRVRRAIFPLREVINRIEKHESTLILKKTKTFYRDIYDHLIQVSENIDIYREMIWSLMDMYMTSISNKMNEVMKVLTIMASIFIPLTFIAGIYGMNFDYIPELHYKYSYFILWGVMITIFLAMLYYFKRKKWL
ncbi:Magnesium transport protein CorA [Mariniflexile rhizosphaerae]|uniref:magnesium/cobalt transporter CorA n=1 Tax=unclassified Mariniflexile TaxID=2643887 RepID=UPI000CA7835D|nr:magnesium/cobalt transporter CorA [Mariniflexile sp. TRM1-10]AXP82956.1 Magnesium transport protein CorA [Mariniflexile sp. TRM1-10]PLB19628.1 MAG: Magnesium and cobalt transport protein CorA [Flavobacteriaceae bacterium FS1-H7996/R]